MTSPLDTDVRELIERLNQGVIVMGFGPDQGEMVDVMTANQAMRQAATALESLLSRIAKLEERVRELEAFTSR
jgi:hypothetical protein